MAFVGAEKFSEFYITLHYDRSSIELVVDNANCNSDKVGSVEKSSPIRPSTRNASHIGLRLPYRPIRYVALVKCAVVGLISCL